MLESSISESSDVATSGTSHGNSPQVLSGYVESSLSLAVGGRSDVSTSFQLPPADDGRASSIRVPGAIIGTIVAVAVAVALVGSVTASAVLIAWKVRRRGNEDFAGGYT